MKLLHVRVDGFGALQGEWTFAPERVNVILDDNERGKSSLFAAIAAALYGLDADRRSHRVVTPLERWRPWNGGPSTACTRSRATSTAAWSPCSIAAAAR